MAIIGKIRKHSSLAVIAVGVAIAAFVLSDLFKSGGGKIPPVAVIEGEEISYQEFSSKVDQNIENVKTNQNKESLTNEEISEVRTTTWNQYLNELIMDQEYEEIGLKVSSAELFDQVQGPDPHRLIRQYFVDPQTQQYNPEMVLQFLRNLPEMEPSARNQWLGLEQFIKRDRLEQKYRNLISKGYYVPDAFAELDYEAKRKTAEILYVAAKYADVSDSLINVTDEDYQAYYDREKYRFTQDVSRDIDYVVFDVNPSEEDRKEIRDNFMRLYEEFRQVEDVVSFINAVSDSRYDSTFFKQGDLPLAMDSIMFNSEVGTFVPPYEEDGAWHMAKLMDIQYRPDSMKAEHILISYAGAFRADQNVTRTKVSAEQLADSLENVISKNKNKLQEIAGEYSDDPSAAQNKGDLGWFADGAMVWPFNQACIEGDVGDVVMVETAFGYHVIHITGKKDKVMKVRIGVVERSIEPSTQTFQDVYTDASRFAGENSKMEKFEEAIVEQGLNKRSATYLRPTANSIAGIPNAREIVRWVYYDGIELGEVSPVFDVGGSYIVAALKEIREEGTIPLEQLKESLATMVTNEKKAEYLINIINQQPKSLGTIAQAVSSTVDTNTNISFSSRNIPGFGSEPEVIGKIFTLEPEKVSGPIKGNGGVFVVMVMEFKDPGQSSNLAIYKQQLQSAFTSKVTSNAMFTALQEKADIEDNRLQYF